MAAEDVLATLKAQLPVDEEAIDARWDSLWAHFDHNGSGTLAYDDIAAPERGLVAFLERAGLNKASPKTPRPPPPKLESEPGAWFDYWDEDGVGYLEEGEVLRALVHSLEVRGDRGQVRGTAELVRACLAACDIQSRVTREDFVREDGLATVVAENLGLRSFRTETPRPVDTPNYDISVRTNGGRTFAATDVPAGILSADTTVESLQSMIAQLSDSRPESIRLVNRGNVLRDDSLSLRDAGVQPGDQLMLVVMAGATRHSTRPPAAGSGPAPRRPSCRPRGRPLTSPRHRRRRAGGPRSACQRPLDPARRDDRAQADGRDRARDRPPGHLRGFDVRVRIRRQRGASSAAAATRVPHAAAAAARRRRTRSRASRCRPIPGRVPR